MPAPKDCVLPLPYPASPPPPPIAGGWVGQPGVVSAKITDTDASFTPLLSADNAPGFNFSSPHGVSFTPDQAPAVADKNGGAGGDGYARQAMLLANYIAGSFPTPATDGGKVIADTGAQNPLLAAPHNHG